MPGPLMYFSIPYDGSTLVRLASSPRLVVLAASAGSLPAIVSVLGSLPANFPAAIALVQHRAPGNPEQLIGILSRQTALRVCTATDGVALETGTVYVCPPAMHMIAAHSLLILDGPRLNFVRPSADLMFESVATTYGDRAIGIVLSGAGSDAARGSVAIARAGGIVIAQDESSSAVADMPRATIAAGVATQILNPEDIGKALCSWGEQILQTEQSKEHAVSNAVTKTSILLVDDHRIVLDGLRVLIERERDLAVVGEAEEGGHALRCAVDLAPDVVVMDIRMPGVDGIEATQRILEQLPRTKIVALSSELNASSVNRILRAGARGYVTKQRAFVELVQAIRTVKKGETYLSPEVGSLVAPIA
jgi:two-component system chemotaxis response regulator CheB